MFRYKVKESSKEKNAFKVQDILNGKNLVLSLDQLVKRVKEETVSNVVLLNNNLWQIPCTVDSFKEFMEVIGGTNIIYFMVKPCVVEGVQYKCMKFFNAAGKNITYEVYCFLGCRLGYMKNPTSMIMAAVNVRDYSITEVKNKYHSLSTKCAFMGGCLTGALTQIRWNQVNWDENK